MNDIVKVTLNLVFICAAAGLLISATWSKTEPVKLREEAREREEALKALVPQADSIKPVKEVTIADKEGEIYRAAAGGNTIGYVVSGSGRGYSSYIRMLVAVDMDNTVTGINILGHGETPGLGDQIMDDWFQKQFKGKTLDHLVVIKGETDTDIQAISGATISSRAVTKGVKEAVEKLAQERGTGLDDVEAPEGTPSDPEGAPAAEHGS